MTISDEEDENLAHFLESEVLSEVSDQVPSPLVFYSNNSCSFPEKIRLLILSFLELEIRN